ncbi:hypothetical protein Cgig2_010249 [Carnegiea gigantea]|uniref:Uncharacterized protein n=1 Tax=Carnegiea gigantea TaxID=171969 RepID=A0A9Q1JNA7_9CARY|nr:hypothetical protein Cgig2_010249 [Carnegiea gigantea]
MAIQEVVSPSTNYCRILMESAFNSILYPNERLEGVELDDLKIKDFSNCLKFYKLHELRKYLNESLSDHTLLLLSFPSGHRAKPSVKYCEIWADDTSFHEIMDAQIHTTVKGCHLFILMNKLYDIHNSQDNDREKLTQIQWQLYQDPHNSSLMWSKQQCRLEYLSLMKYSLSLMREQSNLDWLHYGDRCTKFFFVKLRWKRMSTYVYSLNDDHGRRIIGFSEAARLMTSLYQGLLVKQNISREHMDNEVTQGRPVLS